MSQGQPCQFWNFGWNCAVRSELLQLSQRCHLGSQNHEMVYVMKMHAYPKASESHSVVAVSTQPSNELFLLMGSRTTVGNISLGSSSWFWHVKTSFLFSRKSYTFYGWNNCHWLCKKTVDSIISLTWHRKQDEVTDAEPPPKTLNGVWSVGWHDGDAQKQVSNDAKVEMLLPYGICDGCGRVRWCHANLPGWWSANAACVLMTRWASSIFTRWWKVCIIFRSKT